MEGEGTESEAALHLDLNSRTFDPKAYIRRFYADATHVDMENTLLRTVNEAAEESMVALKKLIRDNMGTFIDCKEAMSFMYTNDAALFTGEAVGPIADAFRSTLEEGEKLVVPTVELFARLHDYKLTKELLAKLMVVWHVPGVIYKHCGVRVARRQPTTPQRHSGHSCSDSRQGSGAGSGGDTSGEDTDTGDERQSGSFVCADAGGGVTQRISCGALEQLALEPATGSGYVLRPDEEIIYWYGTPLVRRRRRRSHHPQSTKNDYGNDNNKEKKCSSYYGCNDADCNDDMDERHNNYESAVLSLRRAMLYLEENYDLEHATVLGLSEDEDNNFKVPDDHGFSDVHSKHAGIIITYRYAMALLRAALFLNNMMAERLRDAGAVDTVLIEDTLSAMMDTAIATVKLRHFCWTVRSTLQLDVTPNDVMLSLRKELCDGYDDGGDCERDKGVDEKNYEGDKSSAWASFLLSLSHLQSVTDADLGTTAENMLLANTFTAVPLSKEQRLEHPVEYYVRITRSQYTQMMEEIALRLCCEAKEWQQGLMPSNKTTSEKNVADFAGADVFDFVLSGMFGGKDGLISDLNNSCMTFNTLPLNSASRILGADCSLTDCAKVGGFGVDVGGLDNLQNAEAILEAFGGSTGNFPLFTTFSIGSVEMSDVLESSAIQLAMHSLDLLRQLKEGTDVSMNISISAVSADTFVGRLFAACVDNLELAVVSYWGGIAAAVRAGVFDFQPDPGSAFHRMLNGPAVLGARGSDASWRKGVHVGLNADAGLDELPPLTYIPVMRKENPTLKQLSVEVVRQGVKTASDILYSLLLSSVNRTLLRGFIYTMAGYCVSDVAREKGESDIEEECSELHAAILVEVILAQWEKTMRCVSESVRRMKVVIVEGCTSSAVSEAQALRHEVVELLEDLELLRSSIFSCYTHGVGMLAKAYLTLLPLLRSAATTMPTKSTVSARVSREFVSSSLVNKLLNLFSVVIDRTAPFLQRFEVYDGVYYCSSGSEQNFEDDVRQQEKQKQRGRGEYQLRRKSPDKTKMPIQLDSAASMIAADDRKMVLGHVAQQEEMLMTLVTDLFLVFVDALHHDCRRVLLRANAFGEMFEAMNIDSLADVLCLSTAVVPIVIDELIMPCVFQVVTSLSVDAQSQREIDTLLMRKKEHFCANHISRVEEQCQLVIDAMFNMLCAVTQQHLTREVRVQGFMMPMIDWQRVTARTAASAVRPYIADSLLLIARAREGLQVLRQPLLDAAVTQRLVAHLAMAFVTAMTSDENAFEISPDCSTNFLTYGLLLLEAEGRTILSVLDSLADTVAINLRADALLPELNVAREALRGAVDTLQCRGVSVCTALAASESGRPGDDGLAALSLRRREALCEAMVQSAVRRLRSIVEAITAHMDGATIAAAFQPLVGSVTESVAERLGKRREGLFAAYCGRQPGGKKQVKIVVSFDHTSKVVQSGANTLSTNGNDNGQKEDKSLEAAAGLSSRSVQKNTKKVKEVVRKNEEKKPGVTPQAMMRATVLQCAAELEARRCFSKTAGATEEVESFLTNIGERQRTDIHDAGSERDVSRPVTLGDRVSSATDPAVRACGSKKPRRFRRTFALP